MNFVRLTYYLLVINFKDFGYIFWTIGYPLMLVTVFMLTTSNLGGQDMADIEVGIEADHPYVEVLDQIDMIVVNEMTESEARSALTNENISGFITSDGNLIVQNSGFSQSVLEAVINQLEQTAALGVSYENFNFDTSFIESSDMDTEPQVIMYYSVIAMMSFYTMFTSMELISSMRPNLSTMGARFSASPFSKTRYVLASLSAGLSLGLLSNFLVIAYLMIFSQSTLFNHLLPTILLIIAGNFTGLGIGFIIGLIPKINIDVKSIVPVVLVVGLAFTSGLMGPGLRTVINRELPIINELNPLAYLTDALYRVNLMDSFTGYFEALAILAAMTVASFIVTIIALRRKQYDNI